MDNVVHWGVLRHLRREVGANPAIFIAAILFDAVVLGASIFLRATGDSVVLWVIAVGLLLNYGDERLFLRSGETE